MKLEQVLRRPERTGLGGPIVHPRSWLDLEGSRRLHHLRILLQSRTSCTQRGYRCSSPRTIPCRHPVLIRLVFRPVRRRHANGDCSFLARNPDVHRVDRDDADDSCHISILPGHSKPHPRVCRTYNTADGQSFDLLVYTVPDTPYATT